jgi:hypothetical protein
MSLISGNAIFGGDAVNCSSNSISGLAAFFGTATNSGDVTSAVFNDGAVNFGSITSGVFLGSAINSGSVSVAEFFGTASNAGFVVESARFADTSSNVGTVSGSAIFTDTSISDGVVEGAVQLGVNVTEGENQALTETPTEYTQTDGFFPNAHYSSGSKTAPTDYETVVYQVGGFWYKYDGNGNGSLASGNYSDGTSMFTFVNGIKGGAYTPSYNVLGSYYYVGTLTNGTTVLYSDNNLTIVASNITPFVVAGVARYNTDGSGVVTIENIGVLNANYYYAGTLTSGTSVLYSDNALTISALDVPPFIVAGITRYSTNGSGVVTIENIETINSYYYIGTLTSGTTVLYSDDSLTATANDINPFVIAGVARYSTNGSGVVTIENIVSVAFGGTTYYHIGTFGDGTELHTTDALNALAVSIGPINMGDISDPVDGLDDSFSTNELGIVTITYGSQSSSEVKLPYADGAGGASVSYYYDSQDTFGAGIALYTDNERTTLASDLFLVNEDDDTLYTTDGSGVLSIQSISNTSLNNITYYHTGTFTSGTILYGENALTSTVNNLFYYYNDADENTDALYTTDGTGILSIQEAFQVTINGITYRYTGTLTSGSTVLRDNITFDPVGAFSYVDVSANKLYGANSSGEYYEETISSITIDTSTYYYVGALANGTILYSENSLSNIASSFPNANAGDLNNDGFNDLISHDSISGITITYGTE